MASETMTAKSGWKISAHPISWWMLGVTTLAIFMTSVDAAILPTVLPSIQTEFHLDATQAGFVNSMFFLGSIVGALIFGTLSDVIGTGYRRTWTWIIAMGLSVIGGALTYVFGASWLAFVLLRLVMGISRGGSEPTNVALISEWWQREDRGFAVGTHHTGFPIGQFLGPAAIALLIGVTSWQGVFLLLPLVGIPIMVAQAFLGRRANQEKVYGWIRGRGMTPPLPEISQRGQLRNPVSVLREVITDRNARLAIVMIFLFLWSELGVSTFIAVHLHEKAGMSLAAAALASGASGITGWIGQIGWGTLSDRLGRKFALRIIIAGWVVTVALLAVVHAPWQGWVLLLLWGLFRNSPYPVTYALLIDSTPRAAGSAMGLIIGIAYGVSGLLVATVAGFFIDHWGWTANYLMLAGSVALCLVPLAFLRETVARTFASTPASD
ncbi:MFS transporter [Fodinicola acaciae]|uniref:MFS transporter n=1 Tax=Fodinicola acaciae TaxID=2681555 RepID=UPI001C9E6156|nr:MFS transporter [Fodinicola acaciae]